MALRHNKICSDARAQPHVPRPLTAAARRSLATLELPSPHRVKPPPAQRCSGHLAPSFVAFGALAVLRQGRALTRTAVLSSALMLGAAVLTTSLAHASIHLHEEVTGLAGEAGFAAFLARARSATLVVEASVVSTTSEELTARGGGSVAAPLPATRALVRVERSFSGSALPAEKLEVLVPGGRWQRGGRDLVAWVEAAPVLHRGDRVLLLLEPWRGAWVPVDLRAGVARIDEDRRIVFLDPAPRLAGAPETPGPTVRALTLPALHQALTQVFAPTAEVGARDIRSASAEFALTLSPDALPPFGCGDGGGNALRWFEFDRGQTLDVFAQASGQPGVPDGGFAAAGRAVAAWSADSASRVLLRYGGTTSATQAIAGLDGLSSIAFEDPGDQFPGSFPSRTLLALTVAFFDCSRLLAYASGLAHPLVEFGIVTQNGIGSFFLGNQADPDATLAELLAHELGHGLGFAHPCDGTQTNPCVGAEDDALMRAVLHQNGRDATLAADDRAALAFLYPSPAGPPPAAPTSLAATPTSVDAIELTWQSSNQDLIAFEIEARGVGQPFQPLASAPPSARSFSVTGLSSQVPLLFRIRARSSGGLSLPSAEAAATPKLASGACVDSQTTLCLTGGRFLTRSFYAAPDERGAGNTGTLTADTGTFWFFQPSNVELIVKVLDACAQFGRFWVFAGALTDVETALLVGDTLSGETRTYFNPPSTPFLPVQDTGAFAQCP